MLAGGGDDIVRMVGGSDTIAIGRAPISVALDLNGFVVNGTAGDDVVRVSRSGAQARAAGARDRRRGGLDVLRVNTLAGDDEVTIESNLHDLLGLAVDLGADD